MGKPGKHPAASTDRSTIGFMTPFSPDLVRSPYLQALLGSMMEKLLELEHNLKWIMIRDKDLDNTDLAALIGQYGPVDGFVVPCWRHFPHLIEELQSHPEYPTVLINDFDPEVALSSIYCDNRAGVRQLFDHFQAQGYKKMGMVKGPEDISPDARERSDEFLKCAAKAKTPLDERYIYESSRFDEEAGYHVMRFWIQRGDLPQAIFCANDDLARGSIHALQEKGIRIPDQVAIAGFDDSKELSLQQPPLTTIHQPLDTIGAAAVETVLNLIQKKSAKPIRLQFDVNLVVRAST